MIDVGAPAAPPERAPRRPLRTLLIVVGLIIALPAAVALTGALTAPPTPDAFRIFDGTASVSDTPASDGSAAAGSSATVTSATDAAWEALLSDTRRLSEGPRTLERDGDVSLVAYLARVPGPEGAEEACIAVFRIGQELASACTAREDFLTEGVRAEAEQASSVLQIEWMPDGSHSLTFESDGPTTVAALSAVESEPISAILAATPARELTARPGGVVAGPLPIGENRTWALASEIRAPYDGRGEYLMCVRSTYVTNPDIAQSGTCAPVSDFLVDGLSGAATLGTFWTPWSLEPDGTLLLGDG